MRMCQQAGEKSIASLDVSGPVLRPSLHGNVETRTQIKKYSNVLNKGYLSKDGFNILPFGY